MYQAVFEVQGTHWQTPMHFQSQLGYHLLQEALPNS